MDALVEKIPEALRAHLAEAERLGVDLTAEVAKVVEAADGTGEYLVLSSVVLPESGAEALLSTRISHHARPIPELKEA